MYDCEGKVIYHASNICETGFYHILNPPPIRKSLDLKIARTAAAAFTISSLDSMYYCMVFLKFRFVKYNWYRIQQQG